MIEDVTRRRVFPAAGLLLPGLRCFAAAPGISIRGKLTRLADNKPALDLASHKAVWLDGDRDTTGVIKDRRLLNSEVEAIGRFTSPESPDNADHFLIDGIYEQAILIHKDGKRFAIASCSIRTYTPGNCVCCQNYTQLDLRDSDQP
jgi:hypothetical protein